MCMHGTYVNDACTIFTLTYMCMNKTLDNSEWHLIITNNFRSTFIKYCALLLLSNLKLLFSWAFYMHIYEQ